MEGWGLLFKVRKHLVWSGGGQSGQTCPNFIRGDPVKSIRKEKILRDVFRNKKRDYVGIIPTWADPPPLPPYGNFFDEMPFFF